MLGMVIIGLLSFAQASPLTPVQQLAVACSELPEASYPAPPRVIVGWTSDESTLILDWASAPPTSGVRLLLCADQDAAVFVWQHGDNGSVSPVWPPEGGAVHKIKGRELVVLPPHLRVTPLDGAVGLHVVLAHPDLSSIEPFTEFAIARSAPAGTLDLVVSRRRQDLAASLPQLWIGRDYGKK